MVESSDLLFAIDSLPAVIAVTADPFIAFSSNAFAILGLRSLYFVIAPMIAHFHYMKQSLICLLGVHRREDAADPPREDPDLDLARVASRGILAVGVLARFSAARRAEADADAAPSTS